MPERVTVPVLAERIEGMRTNLYQRIEQSELRASERYGALREHMDNEFREVNVTLERCLLNRHIVPWTIRQKAGAVGAIGTPVAGILYLVLDRLLSLAASGAP